MYINIVKIANEIFKDKNTKLLVKEVSQNRVLINYTLKNSWHGNYNRKPFVLPSSIPIDQRCVEALALFLGDGDPHRKDKNHLSYSSKDKDLIIFFLGFLRQYFYIKNKDITVSVFYKKKDPHIIKEWSSILHVDRRKIFTKQSSRHRNQTCVIQVNGVIFRKLFDAFVEKIITRRLLRIPIFRRAFLRGLFAAEGCIGIDFLSGKPYISQVSYSISFVEKTLESLICFCLDLEKIHYRVYYREESSSTDIIISNWENYLKLWWIGTFNLCKRKKYKFFKVARNIDIYAHLHANFRKKFFQSIHLYQAELATIIDSWQANVCKTIRGKHLLRMEQFKELIPYSNYNKVDILKNTAYFRIGSLTKINPSLVISFFLYEIKSF